jgi:type I restriction enzyme S subunit
VEGFTHNGEFVLIAEDGANDLNNYPVHYVNGKVWVNNHAHVLQAKEEISDNKFLMYSFKTIDIATYLVGGSRAKLNANTMMGLTIYAPNRTEQTQIGHFFNKLDNFIALHQRKLEKQKSQGLLDSFSFQSLFVSTVVDIKASAEDKVFE